MFKVNANVEAQLVKLEVRESQAHCACIQEESDGNSWYHDILRYVKNQQYLDLANDNDKRTLRRLAMGFFLDEEVLYKKSKDQILLRCVDATEGKKIVHEIHEGVCGTHANGHVMARQIIRAGYYWMTLENDCINYVRKCHKCQIYADKIHVPPTSLNVMVSPWPFSMWGMDSIAFHPQTVGQFEITIQTLEDILRACILEFKYNWVKHLPLVEFAYNNNYQASIGMPPYEAL